MNTVEEIIAAIQQLSADDVARVQARLADTAKPMQSCAGLSGLVTIIMTAIDRGARRN